MQILQGALTVAKVGYQTYEAYEHLTHPSGANTTGGGGAEAGWESGLATLLHINGGDTGATHSTTAPNHGQQAQHQAQGNQNNQNTDNGNILSALLQQAQGGQNNQNTDGGDMSAIFFGQTPAGQNDQSGGNLDSFGALFGQAQGGQSDQWGGSNDGAYNSLMQGVQVNAGDGNTVSGYNAGC
jgi:hypothetical protein